MPSKYVSRHVTEEERDLVDGIRYLLGKEPLPRPGPPIALKPKPMALKIVPASLEEEITPLTREQILILETLERHGPTKALLFDAFEDQLDDLFKMRPRLIELVKGHVDPVVDISPAGRLVLNRALS